MIKNLSPVNLVVVGLGLGLIVFVAGVSTILALNRAVPTEMWAAGGAISGALVGLLVPAPSAGQAAASQQAAPPAQQGAAPQGQQAAAQHQPQPGVQAQGVQPLAPAQPESIQPLSAQQAPAHPEPQPPQPAAQQPQPVQPAVQPAANAPGGAAPGEARSTHIAFVILLLIVFVLTLVGGVALSAGWIVPPSGFADQLHEATKVLITLASGSGTALIGVFAPTSQHG